MGYETKLIIGNKGFAGYENKDCTGVIEIASIDLCKCVFTGTQTDETASEKACLYGDGDTEIREDRYGAQLYHNDPKKVLQMIVDSQKDGKYRRYSAAIPLLKSLIKDFKHETLTCILYGH